MLGNWTRVVAEGWNDELRTEVRQLMTENAREQIKEIGESFDDFKMEFKEMEVYEGQERKVILAYDVIKKE